MIECSRCRRWTDPLDIRIRSLRPVCLECATAGEERRKGRRPPYTPSEQEIATGCQAILEGESEQQLKKRAGQNREYAIPQVHISAKAADKLNLRGVR